MTIPHELYPLVDRWLAEHVMGWVLVDDWIYEGTSE